MGYCCASRRFPRMSWTCHRGRLYPALYARTPGPDSTTEWGEARTNAARSSHADAGRPKTLREETASWNRLVRCHRLLLMPRQTRCERVSSVSFLPRTPSSVETGSRTPWRTRYARTSTCALGSRDRPHAADRTGTPPGRSSFAPRVPAGHEIHAHVEVRAYLVRHGVLEPVSTRKAVVKDETDGKPRFTPRLAWH